MTGAALASLLALAAAGCASEVMDVKQASEKPQAEQQEIVPVGGYELLAGTWRTQRSDEVVGRQEVPLLIEVQRDVLVGAAPDHNVRLRCQASHRTCTGRWSDNVGSGRVTLIFDTDFHSFTGNYDGTSEGRDVGRSTWTGTKQ